MIWDSQANSCPKKDGYASTMVHPSKINLDLTKVLLTDWFDNYSWKSDTNYSTSSFVYLWGASKVALLYKLNKILKDYLIWAREFTKK